MKRKIYTEKGSRCLLGVRGKAGDNHIIQAPHISAPSEYGVHRSTSTPAHINKYFCSLRPASQALLESLSYLQRSITGWSTCISGGLVIGFLPSRFPTELEDFGGIEPWSSDSSSNSSLRPLPKKHVSTPRLRNGEERERAGGTQNRLADNLRFIS
ncbi:hypothetical protein H112_00196 [Trichophyton rubrum D6]|uniref:Uncharacterized protein n=3 Tax=Trichophyton TaxID=5550 RepID=A0A080WRW4_TRIRC|nr:uncharacterized protein TERG_12694 [Trichophyton rubrum CBS 118892]EZF27953.1 hypothetical protein H100_00196 [Trichophyton rubrum MR850]EZF46959.1 hypothetical protein H102_00195 [Trichophyton rubrum CBS 100081]EZF57584.1 hypothetical protein H103_00197 [Trichophyton rubrum CBS 288.86]EZF68237.1 hypothetical protein H104_00196 [Trichophyton rubrum CBS 289.86]EZF78854.1 hypothetical protein H105_00188 [Trichophyton soudanense CBS 452.61]EZF89522.1 hypothetical protein H110_00196 [Trichophy